MFADKAGSFLKFRRLEFGPCGFVPHEREDESPQNADSRSARTCSRRLTIWRAFGWCRSSGVRQKVGAALPISLLEPHRNDEKARRKIYALSAISDPHSVNQGM